MSDWNLPTAPVPLGQKLVVGVSGGSDSLGLLLLLLEQLPRAERRLVVVHVNYGLRGKESDRDETLVRRLCHENRLVFERLKVPRSKKARKSFSQERGREIRYSFFLKIARKHKAWGVVVAHHQEDQAETVLDRLLRGAGPRGLSGLREVQVLKLEDLSASLKVWRPLLSWTKSQIQDFLKAKGIRWREDNSNQRNFYRRNQIRNEIIPYLRRWNPQLTGALAHVGEITAAEDFLLESLLAPLGKKLESRWEREKYSCDPKVFEKVPLALQRRWVRRVVEELTGRPVGLSFERIEEILRLWEGREKGPRNLGFKLVAGKASHRAFLLLKG